MLHLNYGSPNYQYTLNQPHSISIIGSGNVATSLALALEKAGHQIEKIWSRHLLNAQALCSQLHKSTPTDQLDLSESDSDIFIIAIPDEFIPKVLSELQIPKESILVHTSGTFSLESFEDAISHNHLGVFYPLQTFLKEDPTPLTGVPLLLEFGNKRTEPVITALAESLTTEVHHMTSADRAQIHVAAVFASNFVNHLLFISENLLAEKNITLNILEPLVKQSMLNIFLGGPATTLTGPAKRKDLKTINAHLALLNPKNDHSKLYLEFTKQIAQRAKWNFPI